MGKGINEYQVKEAGNVALGQLGFDELTTGASQTPSASRRWIAFMSDTDATYEAVSESGDDLSSQTRIAGRIVYGDFSEITITGGTVLAYRG